MIKLTTKETWYFGARFLFCLNDDISDMLESFQDGVDSIYELLKSLEFTPDDKSLDSIKKALQKMYTDRYTQGETAGKANGQKLKSIKIRINHESGGVMRDQIDTTFNVNYNANGNISSITGGTTGNFSNQNGFRISYVSHTVV